MTQGVPPEFSRIVVGGGFDSRFGPIYQDRAGQRLAFRVSEHHGNPVGMCHGGALATFADMQIVLAGGETYEAHMPTVSLSVDFVGPIPVGAWVEAPVTCVRRTRSLVFTQTVITADGRTVARSNAIYSNTSGQR